VCDAPQAWQNSNEGLACLHWCGMHLKPGRTVMKDLPVSTGVGCTIIINAAAAAAAHSLPTTTGCNQTWL